MAFSLPGVPFKLTQEDMGVPNLVDALTKGIQLGFLPSTSKANLDKTLVDNLHQQLVNQYYGKDIMSQIAARGAQANYQNSETRLNDLKYKNPALLGSDLMRDAAIAEMLKQRGGQEAVDAHEAVKQAYPDAPPDQTVPLAMQMLQQMKPNLAQPQVNLMQSKIADALMQQPAQQELKQTPDMNALQQSLNNVLNPPQPQQQMKQTASDQNLIQRAVNAEIADKEAMSQYYNQGAGKGGVAIQNQRLLQTNILRDNPQMTADEAYVAAGRVLDGETTMPDGKPINVSQLTAKAADAVSSAGIPASVRSQNIQANQASAEMDVLNKYSQAGLEPYGTTYFGMSPAQISDSFKSDDSSQKRLGRLIAAQQLQYDVAQNQIRIAMGRPGVRTTEELMKLGMQTINSQYPKLSGKARDEARRYTTEALNAALDARNKLGKNPYQIGNSKKSETISDEDIKHTAEKYKMTEDEVRQKLKEQGRL